jgi:hypothetical protein
MVMSNLPASFKYCVYSVRRAGHIDSYLITDWVPQEISYNLVEAGWIPSFQDFIISRFHYLVPLMNMENGKGVMDHLTGLTHYSISYAVKVFNHSTVPWVLKTRLKLKIHIEFSK